MKYFNFLTNDGYGQRDDQDPADGAAAPDHLAKARSGADVAVTDLGKINNGKIETILNSPYSRQGKKCRRRV